MRKDQGAEAPRGPNSFLVKGPLSEDASREELHDAIRSLLSERDYLRSVRDIDVDEHMDRARRAREELNGHRELIADLKQELEDHREHVQALEQESNPSSDVLEAHRAQAATLIEERDALRAHGENLRVELDASQAQVAALSAEAEALRGDRDEWRERATRAEHTLAVRISGLIKRLSKRASAALGAGSNSPGRS